MKCVINECETNEILIHHFKIQNSRGCILRHTKYQTTSDILEVMNKYIKSFFSQIFSYYTLFPIFVGSVFNKKSKNPT